MQGNRLTNLYICMTAPYTTHFTWMKNKEKKKMLFAKICPITSTTQLDKRINMEKESRVDAWLSIWHIKSENYAVKLYRLPSSTMGRILGENF